MIPRFLKFGLVGLLPFLPGCMIPQTSASIQKIEQSTLVEEKQEKLEEKINVEDREKGQKTRVDQKIEGQEKNNVEEEKKEKFLKPYLGFNALEFLGSRNEATNESYLRNRLYAEVGLCIGPIHLNYSSTNDLDNLDHARYFGRHVPGIGLRDGDQLLMGVVKTMDREVLDAKVGIRDKWIPGKIGYGYLDLSFEKKAGNLTFLVGRNFGEKFFLELYNDTELPFRGELNPAQYNEIQPGYKISDKIDLTARIEVPEFDFDEAIYMLGLRINLP